MGESQPAVFVGHVLPWQLQSPIFPNIGLLMACAAQSLDRGVLPEKNTESLSMKARALANVGRFLRQHVAALGARGGDGVQESLVLALAEAIKCVINLVVMEVSLPFPAVLLFLRACSPPSVEKHDGFGVCKTAG